MNFIKRLSAKTGGVTFSIALGGVKSVWSFARGLFGRHQDTLLEEFKADYAAVKDKEGPE